MNKTFVADLENHFVYLISNGLMSFYINISKKQESTNITIDMKTKKKDDLTKIIGSTNEYTPPDEKKEVEEVKKEKEEKTEELHKLKAEKEEKAANLTEEQKELEKKLSEYKAQG